MIRVVLSLRILGVHYNDYHPALRLSVFDNVLFCVGEYLVGKLCVHESSACLFSFSYKIMTKVNYIPFV